MGPARAKHASAQWPIPWPLAGAFCPILPKRSLSDYIKGPSRIERKSDRYTGLLYNLGLLSMPRIQLLELKPPEKQLKHPENTLKRPGNLQKPSSPTGNFVMFAERHEYDNNRVTYI